MKTNYILLDTISTIEDFIQKYEMIILKNNRYYYEKLIKVYSIELFFKENIKIMYNQAEMYFVVIRSSRYIYDYYDLSFFKLNDNEYSHDMIKQNIREIMNSLRINNIIIINLNQDDVNIYKRITMF